ILDRDAPRLKETTKSDPPAGVSAAPNAQFAADMKVLVAKKIVDQPDYWLANAQKGRQCAGPRVEALLLNMARAFEPASDRGKALGQASQRWRVEQDVRGDASAKPLLKFHRNGDQRDGIENVAVEGLVDVDLAPGQADAGGDALQEPGANGALAGKGGTVVHP